MAERKTVRKWFWVWEFDKEERWLNQMALSGWALVEVGFCRYVFDACEPGAYIIRLQMSPGDDNYLDFLKDTGAEYIGRVTKWIYLRRDAALGDFQLFSDNASRLEHLGWIARMLLVIGVMNLVIGVVNSFNGTNLGAINLICATLLMYGLGRIHGKMESLEKDRELEE